MKLCYPKRMFLCLRSLFLDLRARLRGDFENIFLSADPPKKKAKITARIHPFCLPFPCRDAPQTEAGILTNLPLWSRRPNHRACCTKVSPPQSYKRRCMACRHFSDDQTLRLQAGARKDDFIHLPRDPYRVACERQEEEVFLPIINTDHRPSMRSSVKAHDR